MKNIELLEAFEIEIDKLDSIDDRPQSMDIEWWLNNGLLKFCKERYKEFELNQKRIDDLRTLVVTKEFTDDSITKKDNIDSILLPEDYQFMLGDSVFIVPTRDMRCWEKDTDGNFIPHRNDTLESTIETIDRQLKNSLSEHRLRYRLARPLKLVLNNTIYLYTDGKYSVNKYILTYLKTPDKIDIHTNPTDEYIGMPKHTQSEIVKLAALMYIENKMNPRYNTYSNEVNQME